jgi:hypothetical protein
MEPVDSPYPRPETPPEASTRTDKFLLSVYLAVLAYGLAIAVRKPPIPAQPGVSGVVRLATAIFLITACGYAFRGQRFGFGLLGGIGVLRALPFLAGTYRNLGPHLGPAWWFLALTPLAIELYALLRYFGLFGSKPPPSRA